MIHFLQIMTNIANIECVGCEEDEIDSSTNGSVEATSFADLHSQARANMKIQMAKLGYDDERVYINNMGFTGH